MIEKIILKNYENHLNSEIDLEKGINIITGQTDSGKSAIIRALLSVIYRDSFSVNDSHSTGSVTIHTSDGDVISRVVVEEMEKKKCPSCNIKIEGMANSCPSCQFHLSRKTVDDYYVINGKRTENTGIEVPIEVSEKLKMQKISLNEKKEISLNLFKKNKVESLIDLQADERTGLIGSVGSDLLLLDSKTKRVVSRISESKQEIKELQSTMKSAQIELQKLDILDSVEPLVEDICKYIKEKENIERKINIAKFIKDNVHSTSVLTSILYPSTEISQSNSDLSFIKSKIELSRNIEYLENAIWYFSDIEEIQKVPDLSNIIDRLKVCLTIKELSKYENSEGILSDILSVQKDISTYQEILSKLEKKINSFKKIKSSKNITVNFPNSFPELDMKKYKVHDSLCKYNNETSILVNEIEVAEYELDKIKKDMNGIEVCPLCNKGDFHVCV